MAVRIPWDEQETAILIVACESVINGEKSQKEAVSEVSHILRERAKNRGISIDDVFRNENGISMQFSIIKGLILSKESGLHTASKLFRSMVQLYKFNREKFDEILKGGGMNSSINNLQNSFSKWLSERLTPAQMSEIYITYYDIDEYLKKEHILLCPLLETTDLNKIEMIRELFAVNGKFRFLYRNKLEKYIKAIGYYYTWLSEYINKADAQNNKERRENIMPVQTEAKKEQPNLEIKAISYENAGNEDNGSIKYVKFGSGASYDSTQVEYFEYFGTRQYDIKSWGNLYMDLLRCLIEDYPDKIRSLKGKSIDGGSKIDIGDWSQSLNMNSPRMFEIDMYVETNLSVVNILDKIKQLMNMCGIADDNIVIAYSYKRERNVDEEQKTDKVFEEVESYKPDASIKKQETGINDGADELDKRRKLFSDWLMSKKIKQGFVRVSLMDISRMSKIAENRGITDRNLYFIESPSALRIISGRLQRCRDFLNLDSRLQKQYKETLNNFIDFRTDQQQREKGKNVEESSKCCERSLEEDVINTFGPTKLDAILSNTEKKLAEILKEDYVNGFRINSAIDKGRIRLYFSERFGEEITISDDQIIALLQKIGTMRGDRIFTKQDVEQTDLLDQIYETVIGLFENGASCAYITSIYQHYDIELADKVQIYDANDLGTILVNLSKGKLIKKKSLLCIPNRRRDLEKDVLDMFKKSPTPLSYDEICKIMWYVPIDKIKHIMITTKSIVYVESETYFYAPNLPINQEEMRAIRRIIQQSIEGKSYITGNELRRLIEEHLPSVAINTSEFTDYGFRNCLGYILRDFFEFRGSIISNYGSELGMAEVFAEYCREREQVTMDELRDFAVEMDTTIYWDAVRQETIRVSEKLLLREDQINFDVEAIDEALDRLINKEYVPLKDIGLFMQFPTLSVQWNSYVLESFVYKYSKKFRLFHTSFSASGFFGAVVRADSTIMDYRSLIVKVLANSNQWSGKKDALELLVNEGYQKTKKYADIDEVLHEAGVLREKINDAKK